MKKEVYNKILQKWYGFLAVIPPIGIIMLFITGVLTKDTMYSSYFKTLVFNWIFWGGWIIWITGAVLIQYKFVLLKSKDKNSFICLLIFIFLIVITGKSLVNGGLHKSLICYAKDLSYAEENLYCENIEVLNRMIKTERPGKSCSVTIYLETKNDTYQLSSNIVTKNTYEEFRSKFKKDDKVKIKYLPNTKFILSVEPANE